MSRPDATLWQFNLWGKNFKASRESIGAILDAGSSYVLVPESDMLAIKEKVENEKGRQCNYVNNLIGCICNGAGALDSDFPELTFEIGNSKEGAKFRLKGSGYFKYQSSTNECVSLFRTTDQHKNENYWILGTPIYRSF